MRRLLPALAALLLAGSTPALANWTASGGCGYVDREFDASGFTGVEPIRPVRFAEVQVISGSSTVIGSSLTDANGTFSFLVTDSQTRDIYVRCLSRHPAPAGIPVEVRSSTSSSTTWALRGPTLNSHPPTQNVSAGTLVAIPGTGGEAFNLFDTALRAADYIDYLRGGAVATPLLLVTFSSSNPTLSSFNGTAVVAARNAGYDDTVILHEIGHYM